MEKYVQASGRQCQLHPQAPKMVKVDKNELHTYAYMSYFVAPSIYLKFNVLIESGNGSESNPYMLIFDN